jgi:hypothetical protein
MRVCLNAYPHSFLSQYFDVYLSFNTFANLVVSYNNSQSMMKTEKELLPYVIPSVEIIEVEVEKGFAGTNMEDFVEGEESQW